MSKDYACCDYRGMVFVNTLPNTVVYQNIFGLEFAGCVIR